MFLWLSHISLFLHMSCIFVLESTYFKTQKTKTATSPCTYGLPLYREISSPNRPVRDSVSLSNLPCECAFFGLANVNSQLDGFAAFFFQELLIFIPCLSGMSAVIQVLSGATSNHQGLVFHVHRLLEHVRPISSESGETEPSPSGRCLKKLEC